jgi:histidine triad (HIT) family protein
MAEYDSDNIFAKILDKKEPCFKVFESRTSLAFLDAFPITEGHTVVVPKIKGHTDLVSMPPAKSAAFLADVQRVARAVKLATGATGINIWQNNGADAGQTVFHPHVHILPRTANDGLLPQPASSKETITAEVAGPMQTKIETALNPPKPLRRAKFGKVSNVDPDSTGLNLKLKVVGAVELVETKAGKFWEVKCGDPSGTVVVSLREHQKDVAKKDAVIQLRNAATRMVANHVRLAVDKWGKIEASDEGLDGEVDESKDKDVSATEYELVVGK